jgi:hypothetical protein
MKFKKRRHLSLVLTVLLSIGSLAATAVPAYAGGYQFYESGDVFIGTDGSQMPAAQSKQWMFEVNGDHIVLHKYTGDFTSDGSIIGVMPATINGLPVESLWGTFAGLTKLKKSPALPITTESMTGTFQGSGLTVAPTIPETVTSLSHTFASTKITQPPVIPSKVTYMVNCFYDCSQLKQAPVLPESLEIMWGCFSYCKSLTVAPKIPSKVTDMYCVFYMSGVKQ